MIVHIEDGPLPRIEEMARAHILAALTAATVTLLVAFHLISAIGLPQLDFLHLRYEDERPRIPQVPIAPLSAEPSPDAEGTSDDQTRYLLGVGKADITG